MPIAASMLPEFDQEMATTRRVLAGVPDDHWDWKPHSKTWTMGGLATHVWAIVGWTEKVFETDVFDAIGYDPEAVDVHSAARLVSMFDASVARARAVLQAAGDDTMKAHWQLVAGSRKILELPRAGAMRGFVMNHLIHHRAQLSLYFRLADLPVPSIYGPTGDAARGGA